MNSLLNDGRNERAREASDSDLGTGCVGVMVLLRLMAGGLEERPSGAGRGQGRRQGWVEGLGRDLSFSQAVRPPRCSALAGASADDRQTALRTWAAVGGPCGMGKRR